MIQLYQGAALKLLQNCIQYIYGLNMRPHYVIALSIGIEGAADCLKGTQMRISA